MKRAIWNGTVLAESDDIVEVEGNAYFPRNALNMDHFTPSSHQTICPWKGTANYFDIEVNGERLRNGAWYYPRPKDAASHIQNRVAFYGDVAVEEETI